MNDELRRSCLDSSIITHHSQDSVEDMRDVQRIAIVDPSDVTREELRNVLLGMESVWLGAECSRYEFLLDVIQPSQPALVMLSLDSDQTKALQLISQLPGLAPDLPILAISA